MARRLWRGIRRRRDDRGSALVAAMLVAVVLTMLAGIVASSSLADLNRSTQEVQRSASYQAAEAGIEDYLAKLTDDRRYATKYVHPAESTRTKANGSTVDAGGAWDSSTVWFYNDPHNAWRTLGNGYEYNLQVTPPNGSLVITLLATGRKVGSTRWVRSIEITVSAGSLADYQMVANADISYGSTATTNGKIYAGNGSDIRHDGTATKALYAEGQVTGSFVTKSPGVAWYDVDRASPYNIRDGVNPPILFANFASTRTEVTTEAGAVGGVTLPAVGTGYQAWRLVFRADGMIERSKCSSSNLETSTPTCTQTTTLSIPANGAIYGADPILVSGTLDGRVTVATNQSIYVEGNLRYETDADDVLGLIARISVIVPTYAPSTLDWRAATIAETGQWRSAGSSGTHNLMTFTGATATFGGGQMSQFDTRVYNYDNTLVYLPPPYWPVLEDTYEVLSFREMSPP